MGDGVIGHNHVTIPDLIEPVVGFRRFNIGQSARRRVEVQLLKLRKQCGEFIAPAAYRLTDRGNLELDQQAIAEAYEQWKAKTGEEIYKLEEKLAMLPYVEDDVSLTSHGGYVWTHENEAACARGGRHRAPDSKCECGLYSYYDFQVGAPQYGGILGIVSSWGVIEAHQTGMRAQYMRVEALFCDDGAISPTIRTIADRWGIFFDYAPTPEQIKALALEIGNPLPKDMRA